MTNEQRLRNLSAPKGPVDVVLDSDAFNEIDDQYAIAYLLRSRDRLNTQAIYAAPFYNNKVSSPQEGMECSYREIGNILRLMGEERPVFRGSQRFLPDEKTPVLSDAAQDLAKRAMAYSPEKPLYVVAIGAITNIASAILLNPMVAENTVLVWLGGHAQHYHDSEEFNMRQDVAAARVVFGSGVPLVQLPCQGVVNSFTLSIPEIEAWLRGKSALCDYLGDITTQLIRKREILTKPIWDVTAVAWLLNDGEPFMHTRIQPAHMPGYDHQYQTNEDAHPMGYVYYIQKNPLMVEMLQKLTGEKP